MLGMAVVVTVVRIVGSEELCIVCCLVWISDLGVQLCAMERENAVVLRRTQVSIDSLIGTFYQHLVRPCTITD